MLLLATVLLLAGCASPSGLRDRLFEASPDALSPRDRAERVYREAWQTVLAEYVDPTFNGQDWYRWRDRYKGILEDPDDAYVAIQTMLASLNDDYTRFLSPRDLSEQTLQIDSRLHGVGIQITVKNGQLLVVTPLADTPAEKAGIKPMDVITHINGESTAGMAVEAAADRIRGPEGTTVRLGLKRRNRLFSVDVARAEIRIKSVFTKEIAPREIGYIRLNSFISETALTEMEEAMGQMAAKRAVILDLRGNYGGLLNNAVEMADLFLKREEVIVSMVGRKRDRQIFKAKGTAGFSKPMVVLIDGGSASASEILGGALKDHHRATLIGTRTFGKGLVQKINPLLDGSGLNITISKYYTPNGTDIDKKGIAPDIEIPYTQDDFLHERDPQLDAAIRYLVKKEGLNRVAAGATGAVR